MNSRLPRGSRRSSLEQMSAGNLNSRRVWIFDLDNTLYPPSARLFDQIEVRMTEFVMNSLAVDRITANTLRTDYWQRYGTTLAGLMAEHDVDPEPYLYDVHDISFDHLEQDPSLAASIEALPGRKLVYTNGSEPYARNVLAALGLESVFEAVFGVEHADFRPKPEQAAFQKICDRAAIDPELAVMIEDDARNLRAPKNMGMATILVSERATAEDFIDWHTSDLDQFLRAVPL